MTDTSSCPCGKCVDFHAHFLQREVFDTGHRHSVSSCFGRNLLSTDNPVFRRMFDPALQVADMDARGIDLHVLSSADVIQSRSWATPRDEARLSALVNNECVRWIDLHPDRFVGSAVLPLGDMRLALAELDCAEAMGLRVVELPSNHRGAYLGDARFDDLWSAIRERGLVAFIHPEGTTDMWFQDYALWNSIGQSIEEVKVMSSLIYEGVMDRHAGVRIVMAHDGGYMPHYMGRLDRNVLDKPFTTKNISRRPSEYLRDFHYDSCVYDPRTLELLVERVGADRVVLGGDYPVGGFDPLAFIGQADLDEGQRNAIAGGNAMRLLGLLPIADAIADAIAADAAAQDIRA
jgi:aminocarboxymuconate-semialdehyde decarboxylase